MRNGMTQDLADYISQTVITTALAIKLDFKTEPVFVWTGIHPILISGSGDTDLDGNTFESLNDGVVGDIGENTYSYSGSSSLDVTLAVPADPSISIQAAQIYPSEYQSRAAILWRAILMRPSDPLGEPVWVWRRIRTGKMDLLSISFDGNSHNFVVTIEAHQANISNATNQSYLNQNYYDSADTSQDYAASIANGKAVPASSSIATSGSNGGSGLYYQNGRYGFYPTQLF